MSHQESLYGLKQTLQTWFHCFSSFLLSKGFVCSEVDTSMFIYHHQSTSVVILLYVDDMLLTGNNHAALHSFM